MWHTASMHDGMTVMPLDKLTKVCICIKYKILFASYKAAKHIQPS